METEKMLQEIQDKILKRLCPNIDIQYKDLCFLCYNEEEIYLLSGIFGFNTYDAIERIKGDYKDIGIMLYINSNDKKYVGITSGVYDLYKGKIYRVFDCTTNDIEKMRNSFYEYHSNIHKQTIARVLSALGNNKENGHIETHQYSDGYMQIFTDNSNNSLCIWRLINEYGSDAMLPDQSPETIKAIWEIVCK